jgi:hypothetical protein
LREVGQVGSFAKDGPVCLNHNGPYYDGGGAHKKMGLLQVVMQGEVGRVRR